MIKFEFASDNKKTPVAATPAGEIKVQGNIHYTCKDDAVVLKFGHVEQFTYKSYSKLVTDLMAENYNIVGITRSQLKSPQGECVGKLQLTLMTENNDGRIVLGLLFFDLDNKEESEEKRLELIKKAKSILEYFGNPKAWLYHSRSGFGLHLVIRVKSNIEALKGFSFEKGIGSDGKPKAITGEFSPELSNWIRSVEKMFGIAKGDKSAKRNKLIFSGAIESSNPRGFQSVDVNSGDTPLDLDTFITQHPSVDEPAAISEKPTKARKQDQKEDSTQPAWWRDETIKKHIEIIRSAPQYVKGDDKDSGKNNILNKEAHLIKTGSKQSQWNEWIRAAIEEAAEERWSLDGESGTDEIKRTLDSVENSTKDFIDEDRERSASVDGIYSDDDILTLWNDVQSSIEIAKEELAEKIIFINYLVTKNQTKLLGYEKDILVKIVKALPSNIYYNTETRDLYVVTKDACLKTELKTEMVKHDITVIRRNFSFSMVKGEDGKSSETLVETSREDVRLSTLFHSYLDGIDSLLWGVIPANLPERCFTSKTSLPFVYKDSSGRPALAKTPGLYAGTILTETDKKKPVTIDEFISWYGFQDTRSKAMFKAALIGAFMCRYFNRKKASFIITSNTVSGGKSLGKTFLATIILEISGTKSQKVSDIGGEFGDAKFKQALGEAVIGDRWGFSVDNLDRVQLTQSTLLSQLTDGSESPVFLDIKYKADAIMMPITSLFVMTGTYTELSDDLNERFAFINIDPRRRFDTKNHRGVESDYLEPIAAELSTWVEIWIRKGSYLKEAPSDIGPVMTKFADFFEVVSGIFDANNMSWGVCTTKNMSEGENKLRAVLEGLLECCTVMEHVDELSHSIIKPYIPEEYKSPTVFSGYIEGTMNNTELLKSLGFSKPPVRCHFSTHSKKNVYIVDVAAIQSLFEHHSVIEHHSAVEDDPKTKDIVEKMRAEKPQQVINTAKPCDTGKVLQNNKPMVNSAGVPVEPASDRVTAVKQNIEILKELKVEMEKLGTKQPELCGINGETLGKIEKLEEEIKEDINAGIDSDMIEAEQELNKQSKVDPEESDDDMPDFDESNLEHVKGVIQGDTEDDSEDGTDDNTKDKS